MRHKFGETGKLLSLILENRTLYWGTVEYEKNHIVLLAGPALGVGAASAEAPSMVDGGNNRDGV